MNPRVLRRGQYLGQALRRRSTEGVMLTLTSYEAGRRFDAHVHEHPGFFLLVAGGHREVRGSSSLDQEVASAIFHKTSQAHATQFGPGRTVGLNISYDRRWLSSVGVKEGDLHSNGAHRSSEVRFHALRLLSLGFLETVPDDDIETLALEALGPLTAGEEARAPRWLTSAVDSIHGRYVERLSLRVLAHEAAVHPNYFARVFRHRFSCSVYDYIHRVRLAEAARLIQVGASIGDAAILAGFSDQAHLSRIFRRELGSSPGSLRRLLQGQAPEGEKVSFVQDSCRQGGTS